MRAFRDLAEGTAACPPGCTHLSSPTAPWTTGCGQGGTTPVARLDSLRRLLRSREGAEP